MKKRVIPEFRLREGLKDVKLWASRYDTPYDRPIEQLQPIVRSRGHLTLEELKTVGAWKAKRASGHMGGNEGDFVVEVTRTAFSTPSERLRIEVLTLLKGVGWPTASVLLHWFHKDEYPILDVRALWSMSVDEPPAEYWFAFWWSYVLSCRSEAQRHNVDMRTLDRALWQFSKEKQPRSGRRDV